MEKAQEFLLEKAMDDLVLSCDSKGEYVYASDMMQKYADQQCAMQRDRIQSEKQFELRSELLKFLDWHYESDVADKKTKQKIIDCYLKHNHVDKNNTSI